MDGREFSDAQRVRYLKSLNANGRIVTDGCQYLADEVGQRVMVCGVRVDYVSAVVGDVVYASIATQDGTGTALAILDASAHGTACGWMAWESVDLTGRACLLFDQPAIDLRRAQAVQPVPAQAGEPLHERIESGEFSPGAVAQHSPDLWDAVNDLFFDFDLKAITAGVLDHRQTDMMRVIEAVDDWFGDIPDRTLMGLYGDDEGEAS